MAALVIHANAIERDVALVAARSIDRAASRVARAGVRAISGVGDTRLQGEQVRHIAALQGQLLYLVFAKRYAQRCIGGVKHLRLGGNFHGFGGGADLQFHIGGRWIVNQELQALLVKPAESLGFDGQLVRTRLQSNELIEARRAAGRGALERQFVAGQLNAGPTYYGPGRVGNRSVERSSAGLRHSEPTSKHKQRQYGNQTVASVGPSHGMLLVSTGLV